jgi:hypothetical protein
MPEHLIPWAITAPRQVQIRSVATAPSHTQFLGRTSMPYLARDCNDASNSAAKRLGFALLMLLCALACSASVSAQTLNDLSDALGGAKSGGLGALGGGQLPAVDQASTSNLAGVLQYCIKNNYLGGSNVTSVEQSLLGKAGGSGAVQKDQGFLSGNKGLLETGNSSGFTLGGDGLQKSVTDKVCDLVLEHAQSLL